MNTRTKVDHDASLLKRFWAKVDTNGPVPESRPDLGQCWPWTAALDTKGYGKIWATGKAFMWGAHRLSYDIHVGLPEDDGLVLDHLCRNRRCVNPLHLEPVTFRTNVLRGETFSARQAAQTHCHLGHPLSGDNLYVWSGAPNHRACRKCRLARTAAHDMKRRERNR